MKRRLIFMGLLLLSLTMLVMLILLSGEKDELSLVQWQEKFLSELQLHLLLPTTDSDLTSSGVSFDQDRFLLLKNESDYPIKKIRAIFDELKKYPDIKNDAQGLEKVILVKRIKLNNTSVEIVPRPEDANALIIGASGGNLNYSRRSIHHELSHYIEFKKSGSYFTQYDEFAKCNDDSHTYLGDGALAYTSEKFKKIKFHPKIGFVNSYAMLGIEEDIAEMQASVISDYRGAEKLAEKDSRLKCKFDLVIKRLYVIDNKIDTLYLQELTPIKEIY